MNTKQSNEMNARSANDLMLTEDGQFSGSFSRMVEMDDKMQTAQLARGNFGHLVPKPFTKFG